MAFVICEQHGGHGAPLLCEHLREAVRRRPGATCGFALDRRRAWMGNVLITAGAEEDYAESLRWYAERSTTESCQGWRRLNRIRGGSAKSVAGLAVGCDVSPAEPISLAHAF